MSLQEAFRQIVSALDQCRIPYMLTGSFASVHYGSPRTTQDIDFVIAASDDQLRKLIKLLPPPRYYADADAALEANRRRSMFNVLDLERGWKIDFMIRKPRTFSEEEFRRRVPVNLAGIDLCAASAEDVVVSKLEWAKLSQSQRHIDDAAGVLRALSDSLDRAYMEKWIRELELVDEWKRAQTAADISA
jgi:hypothetical protein